MDFNIVFALVLAPLCLGSEEDGPGADEDQLGGAALFPVNLLLAATHLAAYVYGANPSPFFLDVI